VTIRIGIVGSDNSHAVAFSQIANGLHKAGRVPGLKVVAISAPHNSRARTREVADLGQIENVVASPEEMVDMVDAAMVVYRHGGLHYEGAAPFLAKRKPTFVDKPMATSVRDAKKILALATKKRALVTSFSTLRFCKGFVEFKKEMKKIGYLKAVVIKGPGDFRSRYGGVFFYGIHAVEMMNAAIGYGVRKVSALRQGKHVLATCLFGDGRIGVLPILEGQAHTFHATAHGTKGQVALKIEPGTPYLDGLKVFAKMIKTGKRPLTDEELLEPVKVLAAIERSIRAKKPVNVPR
jgi:predicted dehydrogenase